MLTKIDMQYCEYLLNFAKQNFEALNKPFIFSPKESLMLCTTAQRTWDINDRALEPDGHSNGRATNVRTCHMQHCC